MNRDSIERMSLRFLLMSGSREDLSRLEAIWLKHEIMKRYSAVVRSGVDAHMDKMDVALVNLRVLGA